MSFAGITSGIMAICASVFFLIASGSIIWLVRYLAWEKSYRLTLDLVRIVKYKDDEECSSVGSSD